MRKTHYTGSLYQLHSNGALNAGAYVEVNGPHDTYGVVLKSERESDGRHLNLIRGVQPRLLERPVARF